MDWITEVATTVVSTALLLSVMVVGMLAYYATGAPGARHELYQLGVQHIHRINGGPVGLGQRIVDETKASLRSVMSPNPFRRDESHVGWARDIEKSAESTEDPQSRQTIYTLLARSYSGSGNADLQRFIHREEELVSAVVNPRALAATDDLKELHLEFRAQDRARRFSILRHWRTYLDRQVMTRICVRGLDYVGRGTAFGLLVGVAVSNRQSMEDMVSTAGATSLLGGACGSVLFLGYLLELLPQLHRPGTRRAGGLDRFRLRHPRVAAATFSIAIGLVVAAAMAISDS